MISGSFREIDGRLYLFGLADGRPQIKVFNLETKAWDLVFAAGGKSYKRCVLTWDGDTCYYHLMENRENKKDDSVPMRVVSLTLKP